MKSSTNILKMSSELKIKSLVLTNGLHSYVKISVRDYLFEHYGEDFSNFKSKKDTLLYLNSHKDEITKRVNDYLIANNIDYRAKTEIVNESFFEKDYGNITLPKGVYDAVIITLGKGEGKNFFFVMFPPMCVDEGITVNTNQSDGGKNGKIVYKSKILELFKI